MRTTIIGVPRQFGMSLALVFAVALSGCALFQGNQNPQQAVFAAQSAYAAALQTAVTYTSLPRCDAPNAPVVCADSEVVAVIQKADIAASASLDSAQTTVRTEGFGDDVYQSAVVAAREAANAFAFIVANLRTN